VRNVPVVTFLSDFGLTDTFVGQMKAMVVSACPTASMIDLTHGIPAQDVLAGALQLGVAYRWFPEGTIHAAVVDPGVGTDRRAIGVRAGGYTFLAPDNGLLSAVLLASSATVAVELERPVSKPGEISRTFHGRDVFAWAAGQLAAGRELEELGTPFDVDELERLDIPQPVIDQKSISGEVLYIDHYGNAVTNIPANSLGDESLAWSVSCGEFHVDRLSSTYADVAEFEPLAAISSMDTIELGIRNGSAAERYNLERGLAVNAQRASTDNV
jgi:S-adenosyl-L-methionine hydrolase (adenosine-forming)